MEDFRWDLVLYIGIMQVVKGSNLSHAPTPTQLGKWQGKRKGESFPKRPKSIDYIITPAEMKNYIQVPHALNVSIN
jgi:hypothetical protein